MEYNSNVLIKKNNLQFFLESKCYVCLEVNNYFLFDITKLVTPFMIVLGSNFRSVVDKLFSF